MKRRPLIKRVVLYTIPILIVSLLIFTFGGVLREYGKIYDLIFLFLIPHYIFGTLFLKTKLIIKFIVPFVTSIVSFGCILLIGKIGFFDTLFDNAAFLAYLVLSFFYVFVWEIVYQILEKVKIDKQ